LSGKEFGEAKDETPAEQESTKQTETAVEATASVVAVETEGNVENEH